MASKLNKHQELVKNKLIMGGCKVIERGWGHLVIMPSMAPAISIFKQAVDKLSEDEQSGHFWFITKTDNIKSYCGIGVSHEYEQKYNKQFAYLKDVDKREKIKWIIEDAIREGDVRKNKEVNDLAKEIEKIVYEINPSLKLDTERNRVENGDIWDAGLIASDDPLPCWDYRQNQIVKRGSSGDGAYRIVINTDTSFGRSDDENASVLCAMIYVLQQYAEVEVWVQQGWLPYHDDELDFSATKDSNNGMNGITLFPAFRGSGMNPAQMLFWAGHPMRDSIFSNVINKAVGRTSSGCSSHAELACDLYTRNACFESMPPFDKNASPSKKEEQIQKLGEWTAKQLSKILIEESDLSTFTND